MVCKEIYGVILDGAAICTDLGSSSNYSGEIQLIEMSVSIQHFNELII